MDAIERLDKSVSVSKIAKNLKVGKPLLGIGERASLQTNSIQVADDDSLESKLKKPKSELLDNALWV